jgi:hypothetical protein
MLWTPCQPVAQRHKATSLQCTCVYRKNHAREIGKRRGRIINHLMPMSPTWMQWQKKEGWKNKCISAPKLNKSGRPPRSKTVTDKISKQFMDQIRKLRRLWGGHGLGLLGNSGSEEHILISVVPTAGRRRTGGDLVQDWHTPDSQQSATFT